MPNVLCGNCKQYHNSAAEVRQCYQGGKATLVQPGRSEPEWPPSDKQVAYVLGLQEERILPANWRVYSEDDLRHMEKDAVSSAIVMLKALPRKDKDVKQWDVPPGRYALLRVFGTDNNPDQAWSFYQVNKPDSGRWAGYTFVEQLIGNWPDYRKIKLPAAMRNKVLREIAQNPKQASLDYGLQSGVCGVCSSPLTNPTSLARGIGPICAAKMEW